MKFFGIEFVEGNILDSHANIIVQSVNHKKVMGSGLAKQIRQKYPNILDDYILMCEKYKFNEISIEGLVYWFGISDDKYRVQYIASIFGQENYGTDRRHTNYFSLINGLNSVFIYAENLNLSVAIPYGIGCGLGGGDWDIVLSLIKDALKCYPTLDVYIYKLPLDK
jgi:O-acetyl-ADP-ribose deacetylase (regulator of RNase III)